MSVCLPCQEGTHLECARSALESCSCFVCIAERIGDDVIGEYPPARADHRDEETAEQDWNEKGRRG